MSEKEVGPSNTGDLCSRAGDEIKGRDKNLEKLNSVERLVHELEVHQIELEMQNDELRKIQIELEESRNRYAELYDFAPAGYFTFDYKGIIEEVNLTGASLLGAERNKLLRHGFGRFVVEDYLALWDRYLIELKQSSMKQQCELLLKREDGSSFYALLESVRVRLNSGAFVLRTTVSDISVRRKSENALLNITSSLAEGIYVLDGQGYITFMNPTAERLLGWELKELSGKNVHDVVHCKKADGSPLLFQECSFHNVIKTGVLFSSMDEAYVAKDGTVFPVSVIASPIIEKGKVVAAVVAFRDITDRKQIEADREKVIAELQDALANVKQLSGLLPICASCKKIRDDKGYWNQIESYISNHSNALFTHGICPECGEKLYPEHYRRVWGAEDEGAH